MTWDYDKALLQAKVQQLRDIDFLLSHADVPPEQNLNFKIISDRADAQALTLTEQLFPDAAINHFGVCTINGEHCVVFSEYWWQQVDAAIV